MRVYLMNKNTKVLYCEIDDNNNFIEIYETLNIDYAPLTIYNAYKDKSKSNLKVLNHWFQGRSIPSWRKDLEKLLFNLNISSPKEILNKAFGLSLSDQYWIKPVDMDIKWENINFFTNDFEFEAFLDVSLNDTYIDNISLHSPNNTTDGMLKKAWVIRNKERCLIKGTYEASGLEPICEWLASNICEIFNISHANYSIEVKDNKLVSVSSNFLKENEEIVTANDIIYMSHKKNDISYYEHYNNILKSNGIDNSKDKLSDMYLIDYLVLNQDRHLKNYGIIRNVDSLEWDRVCPIFDTGEGLECSKNMQELIYDRNVKYKFFDNTNFDFDKLFRYIDLSKYDLEKLKSLPNKLESVLREYELIISIPKERIEITVSRFKERIDKLMSAKESGNYGEEF